MGLNIADPSAEVWMALRFDESIANDVITFEVEDPDGKIYKGKVVTIKDFGAFVNILPGIDGMLHISQISDKRVEKVTDGLKVGQEVKDASWRMIFASSEAEFDSMWDTMVENLDSLGFQDLYKFDVDKFKAINDTYGHDVGDIVLKRFAHGLTDIFREDDLVFRIGGDEFAVILKSNEDVLRNAISAKISHLNSILERGGNRRGSNLPGFTISAGVAFSRPEEDSDTVFKHADSALYEVKRGARRGCAFYSEEV